MSRVLSMALVGAFLAVGCKAKKAPCEEARDLHVAAFERIGKPMASKVAGDQVTATGPGSAAMDRYQAIVDRMKKHYVKACEAAGADMVLACIKKLSDKSPIEPLDPECEPVIKKLKQGVDSASE